LAIAIINIYLAISSTKASSTRARILVHTVNTTASATARSACTLVDVVGARSSGKAFGTLAREAVHTVYASRAVLAWFW
jgi:hypothetical protein